MRPPLANPINVSAMTRRIDVDNRIPLRNYYRIADNLLKQANIYREEKNIIDLYIILLRYSSLVSETIPFHRDYQAFYPKEKAYYKKKLFAVLDELEALKPEARRQLEERNKVHFTTQIDDLDGSSIGLESTCSQWPIVNIRPSLRCNNQQFAGSALSSSWKQNNTQFVSNAPPLSWKQNNSHNQVLPANSIDMKLQNLSLGLPLPKQETLSRHSLLGPNGLWGQWLGPSTEIKVNYPTNSDLVSSEDLSVSHLRRPDLVAVKDGDKGVNKSAMDSVLSLDDGRWLASAEELCISSSNDAGSDHFPLGIIRQPGPPPVLAQVQSEFLPISPSRVADPRPGPAKPTQDRIPSSDSFQHLHIPVKMMDDFLRLARENTARNLETCGVLAGSLKNRVFHITMLIIPKQESTSDSNMLFARKFLNLCNRTDPTAIGKELVSLSTETLNEEEIFEVQDKHSLFPLGWIHTHPSQTCFMSSVDLHTHYSYQIMLPEAIAIVMAPTDESSPHGIFHLSDPGGVAVIRNCQQRGFHPHEEPEDGSPIYEHCSHVYMNERLKFDIVDLR